MLNSHEKFCLKNADYFTAVRGKVGKNRVKKVCATLKDAESFAAKFGDGKTMIYAVSALGSTAHIKNA